MSKISELAMELDDQAMDMGFDSFEDAIENGGYEVDYENAKLVKPDEQEQAHEAWLKEKQQVLDELTDVINDGELDWGEIVSKVEHAIEFIEKGEV